MIKEKIVNSSKDVLKLIRKAKRGESIIWLEKNPVKTISIRFTKPYSIFDLDIYYEGLIKFIDYVEANKFKKEIKLRKCNKYKFCPYCHELVEIIMEGVNGYCSNDGCHKKLYTVDNKMRQPLF